jgi:hypothetical protein
MEQIKAASGKFNMLTAEAEFTRLDLDLSFLQVKLVNEIAEEDLLSEG